MADDAPLRAQHISNTSAINGGQNFSGIAYGYVSFGNSGDSSRESMTLKLGWRHHPGKANAPTERQHSVTDRDLQTALTGNASPLTTSRSIQTLTSWTGPRP